MGTADAANTRRSLISQSAHDFTPAISAFAELGSITFNLYNVVSFDKQHVLYIVVTRQFCDIAISVIRESLTVPLSRSMEIETDHYAGMPPPADVSSHKPFRTSPNDSQAGI